MVPLLCRRVQFVLGFLDPSLQCGTEFGEVELSHCSTSGEECQLVGVFVLNGESVKSRLWSIMMSFLIIFTTNSTVALSLQWT